MRSEILAGLALAGVLFVWGCDAEGPRPKPIALAAFAADVEGHSFETRYAVDPGRGRVWWLTPDGVVLHDLARPGKISVEMPGWIWAGSPYGCLPDLTLGSQGEAIVTSDVTPALWRVDPETLAVSVHRLALETDSDKDVGFCGVAYSPRHGTFFGLDSPRGSLWQIDRELTRARRVDGGTVAEAAYARWKSRRSN